MSKDRRFGWVGQGEGWPLRTVLVAGVFLVAACALYANTFGNAWTLDDFPVIVNNADVQSVQGFWQNTYPGRPLREITFLLDHALFGLEPAGYHMQNIFWHGLNAFLVFLVAGQLGVGRWGAWSAGLLFLFHPLHVEVVANISHRKDSLTLAFSLLSLLAYMRACRIGTRRVPWLCAALALAGIALLGKENALILPLVFLAYELACLPPDGRLLLRRPRAWGGAMVAGIAAGAVWYCFLGGMERHLAAMPGVMAKMNLAFSAEEPSTYFLMVLKSLSFMAAKLIWPVGLAPEYVYPAPKSWADGWVLAALAGLCCYSALLWVARKRCDPGFLALVWMGAFWLPVSNLWPFSYFAADRYLYASSVGFVILLVLLAERFVPRFVAARTAGLGVLLVFLAVLSWNQSKVWTNPLTLWSHASAVNPDSTTALNNLGGAYLEAGDLQKAREYFQQAAMNFNDPMPYYNLGRVYEQLGDRDKAVFYYRNFLAFNDPNHLATATALRRRLLAQYGILLR